jgi:hypothetical protein
MSCMVAHCPVLHSQTKLQREVDAAFASDAVFDDESMTIGILSHLPLVKGAVCD